CATAIASIELLLSQPWQRQVANLNKALGEGLAPAAELPAVAQVRTLGAIGVIELEEPVDMQTVQPMFVERGVWVRPFGKLVYAMPPYVMGTEDVAALTAAMVDVVAQL
ncbi:MAG: aminotransferase class III-fold pyridoxal phosphate-dependent enzyme, partial [Halieaceae bacterium]|nr:aminotransferase class III-fold pyridoxal phosphate-dependent enzyme [Halieaceae bacterium]